jgi:hypothetical protein
MSRWIRTTKDPEWAKLFTGFTKSAYRLEGQQTYSNDKEDAALARFLAGKPLELDLSWMMPKLKAQVAAGRTQTTVRVVVEPHTDYTRFELAVYPESTAAGEDIRVIAVPEGSWPVGVPRHDYWLFDDHDVWRMHYHDNYRFTGAELLDNEDAIAKHLQWRNNALAQAVPLHDYLATLERAD